MANPGNAGGPGYDMMSPGARQQGVRVVQEIRQILDVQEMTTPAITGSAIQPTSNPRGMLDDQQPASEPQGMLDDEPQSSGSVMPIGNRRRRLADNESDVEELRRALEENHVREAQWQQVVQQQFADFAQRERHEAHVAVEMFHHAESEAIQNKEQVAMTRVEEMQARTRGLEYETRQSSKRGTFKQ